MRIRCLLVAMALMPLMAMAQDIAVSLPVPAPKKGNLFQMASESAKGKPVLLQPLYWVKTLIDSSAVATVDRHYIEQPKKPWAVEARTSINHSTLKMDADWSFEDLLEGRISAETDNDFPVSIGVWAGYRGYGLGISKQLGGDGSTFSFGAMGGSFGINLRISNYRCDIPYVSYSFVSEDEVSADGNRVPLDDPIRVRSLFLDGYYMFNGKHFSYSAAYDQSLYQRRSAGSLVAGLMYYHSSVTYDDDSCWPLVLMMRGVGKLKFTQANVGAGYAYNWVPARGWLVSAMFMPMITFYNKTRVYYYDTQDQNGNSIYEAAMYDEDFDYGGNYKVVLDEDELSNNRVNWNFNARMSVVYNWTNFYLRVYGHYNRFRYSNDEGNGHMADWTAYASLGFRF